MRGTFVTLVAALIIGLSIMALVDAERREGPTTTILQPAFVEAATSGTYQARGDSSVLGFCPAPPCTPTTSVDLRIEGLPPAPYSASLEGATTEALGLFEREGDAWVIRWSQEEDHTDKQRIIVSTAGRAIAAVAVRASDDPIPLDASLRASWGAAPADVRINEVGGVTVATVAFARLSDAPPAGWTFRAWLDGKEGQIDLGSLDEDGDGATMDARVERVRLEDQDRIVVGLVPTGEDSVATAFPILVAAL